MNIIRKASNIALLTATLLTTAAFTGCSDGTTSESINLHTPKRKYTLSQDFEAKLFSIPAYQEVDTRTLTFTENADIDSQKTFNFYDREPYGQFDLNDAVSVYDAYERPIVMMTLHGERGLSLTINNEPYQSNMSELSDSIIAKTRRTLIPSLDSTYKSAINKFALSASDLFVYKLPEMSKMIVKADANPQKTYASGTLTVDDSTKIYFTFYDDDEDGIISWHADRVDMDKSIHGKVVSSVDLTPDSITAKSHDAGTRNHNLTALDAPYKLTIRKDKIHLYPFSTIWSNTINYVNSECNDLFHVAINSWENAAKERAERETREADSTATSQLQLMTKYILK